MQTWPVQDANARFSEVSKGVAQRPSLEELLLSDVGRTDLTTPERKSACRRETNVDAETDSKFVKKKPAIKSNHYFRG